VGHVLPNLSLTTLAQRFQRFAQRECHVSPLYARLALGIAEDPEVLAIAAPARPGQPRPNLFLAAVHFLLLQGVSHPLAGFYPSLAAAPAPTADPYPSFRAFCLGHAEALRQLIATRLVQTNEVRRCACLLPGFALVARRGKHRPLALVEIGASAGLNLLWDRYGYEYSAGRRCGDENSPVQLSCSVRRKACPPLPTAWPAVASRVGLELNPLDVRDADAVLWLRALLWPDEAGRAEMLAGAVHIAQQAPPRLLGGDALDRLPEVLAAIPEAHTPCVFHTHTLNQLSPQARSQLSTLLAEHAASRDLYRLSIEWLGTEHPRLELSACERGRHTAQLLAHCGSHGEWLEWLDGR
jgi:hypothetical protein